MDLNELMAVHSSALEEIFGKDVVVDLRGLPMRRMGTNLGNRLAHGLVTCENVQLPRGEYLWWLTLRLCVVCPTKPPEVTDSEPTS